MYSSSWMLLSAADVHTCAGVSLFIARDDKDRGISINFSPCPSSHSRARGRVSLVCPAAVVAATPVGSSHGTRGMLLVSSYAVPDIVNSNDEEPVHSSVRHAPAAKLSCTTAGVSTSAVSASAGMAPAALRRSKRW